jgi:hypothetical protein
MKEKKLEMKSYKMFERLIRLDLFKTFFHLTKKGKRKVKEMKSEKSLGCKDKGIFHTL